VRAGTWIHSYDGFPLEEQIVVAADSGLQLIRSYNIEYAEMVVSALRETGMSLLAGMQVDAEALVDDWRSQVRLDELARYHELNVPLEAVCVGNELREGGDAPGSKHFTARLSFGLANIINTYHEWLDKHGCSTLLTYAMEGIVFDPNGYFNEWVWPLVDACDIVSINAYPMDDSAWFTFDAFEESRRFLHNSRTRNDRLALFELRLRRALAQMERADKRVFLSETGFPSAIGYHLEGERTVVPESDNARYGALMAEYAGLICQINLDYGERIQAAYFYEWRDNLCHPKIWNVEQSPIHVAFGLCDRSGIPKFDIKELVAGLEGRGTEK